MGTLIYFGTNNELIYLPEMTELQVFEERVQNASYLRNPSLAPVQAKTEADNSSQASK